MFFLINLFWSNVLFKAQTDVIERIVVAYSRGAQYVDRDRPVDRGDLPVDRGVVW